MERKSEDMIIKTGSYPIVIAGEWIDLQKEKLPMYRQIKEMKKNEKRVNRIYK